MTTVSPTVHERIDAETLRHEIDRVRQGQQRLAELNTAELLALLAALGERLASPECARIEGIAFLSTWLREKNLRQVLQVNFEDRADALERFVDIGSTRLRAAPRGVVAHWIAGNIPTLAIFSLALSLLVRNANLVRLPQASLAEMSLLLGRLQGIQAEVGGRTIRGQILLDALSVFHFPSDDDALNRQMSLAADARIVWGGHDAVEAITALPRQEHCEDVVFGPKFSLAVIDGATLADEQALAGGVRGLVKDAVLFDQAACSSPHIVFVEGDAAAARRVAEMVEQEFLRLSRRFPKQQIAEATAAAILRQRAEYALGDQTDLLAPADLNYTVLVDSGARLSDGLQSRTLFVRAVDSLDEVLPLLTPKIQTVGVAIAEPGRCDDFCQRAAQRGVSRLTRPGLMNLYETPWDGMRVCDRLVRWVSANC